MIDQSARDAALEYVARGWCPLILKPRTKIPIDKDFNSIVSDINYIKRFGNDHNVGLRLGAASGIVDIDLDCEEARSLASKFLPGDTPRFGRSSTPCSHYLIAYSDELQTKKFTDPVSGSVLLEIRSDKVQTMVPPSVHPNGELIKWVGNRNRAPVQLPLQLIEIFASVVLLSRYWPREGSRQDAHLALIGGLAISKIPIDVARYMQGCLCYATGDREYAMRNNVVDRTYERVQDKEKTVNWGKLSELLQKDGKRIVRTIRTWLGDHGSGKPKLYVSDPLKESVDTCIEAIADHNIFQRSRILTRIVHEPNVSGDVVRPIGAPSIGIMSVDTLREEIESAVDFFRATQKGDETLTKPPRDVAQTILNRSEWPHIRPLVGIVNHPIVSSKGNLKLNDGYDLETGTFLSNVPKINTIEDPKKSLSTLFDLVSDFAFENACDFSSWLAALLTGIVRYSFEDPTPLILVDGNTRGVGKSLLADLASIILYGRDAPRREMPNNPEEWGKSLLGIAISGDPMILLDNVKGKVDSSYFEAILTGYQIQQRILGRNEEIKLPIRTQFWITSNNARISSDLVRRSIRIRLASPHANPESLPASSFRYPRIKEHTKRNRAKYITALLGILNADQKTLHRSMGSFEAWSEQVRSRIVGLGLPDPVTTQDELAMIADDESESISDFVSSWFVFFGDEWVGLSQLIEASAQPDNAKLRSAMGEFCGLSPGERATSRALSRRLREHRDRIIDDYSIRVKADRVNKNLWRVEKLKGP